MKVNALGHAFGRRGEEQESSARAHHISLATFALESALAQVCACAMVAVCIAPLFLFAKCDAYPAWQTHRSVWRDVYWPLRALQGKPIGELARQLAESCTEDELVTAALRALPQHAATQVTPVIDFPAPSLLHPPPASLTCVVILQCKAAGIVVARYKMLRARAGKEIRVVIAGHPHGGGAEGARASPGAGREAHGLPAARHQRHPGPVPRTRCGCPEGAALIV